MPRKVRQLKADLRKAGAIKVSQEGSHTKWKHPLVPDVEVVISGNDGADARPYQEKQVGELLRRISEVQRSEQS